MTIKITPNDKGNPPGNIVIPLGRFGFTFVEVVKTAPLTGLVATRDAGVMMEKRSCKPKKSPGVAPAMPGGYMLWERKPTVRAE